MTSAGHPASFSTDKDEIVDLAVDITMSASLNGSGFFGYLKGLFRRGDNATAVQDYESNNEESPALVPPPIEIVQSPTAAAVQPVPEPAVPANVDTREGGVAPSVAIPLQSILNILTPELKTKVRSQAVGNLVVNITLDKILPQLGQGVVQIPFGDIRKAVPEVFSHGVDGDRVPVTLPLSEILSRINPALLVRRTAHRQVEVPDDISSPFEGKGQGLSLSVGNAKPVQPAAPRKAAPVPQAPVRGSISSVSTPPPPTAAASKPAPYPFTPAKRPQAPAASKPAEAIPFPNFAPIKPVVAQPQPAQQQTPAPQFATAPVQVPQPVAAQSVSSQQPILSAPLAALSATWPEAIRLEIAQASLSDASVALPVDQIESSLKRGRVAFPWKTVRSWIRPATPPTISPYDAAEIELPLKVVAPLFLSRKQNGTANKVAVDETIPNLFFGFPQPEAAAPATPVAPAAVAPAPASPIPPQPMLRLAQVAPAAPQSPMSLPSSALSAAAASAAAAAASAAAASAAASAAAFARPADTNFFLWEDASDTKRLHIEALKAKGTSGTEFVKRYASPNEIVSRAAAIEGVAGVLIALPDGLMVASRLPADVNGDTLAAFLPQIFSKVSQTTKELRMGELNNVGFTVGNVPWKIFRVNAIFFATFGRVGQSLPTAQLAALATELDRKNK